MAKKLVFRKIRGRVIPIWRDPGKQDQFVNIAESQKTRAIMKATKAPDKLMTAYHFVTKRSSKQTGHEISRLIAKLKKMRKGK